MMTCLCNNNKRALLPVGLVPELSNMPFVASGSVCAVQDIVVVAKILLSLRSVEILVPSCRENEFS